MTEVETIAGSTANGTKPFSPDENPGAPEMDRGIPTPVPGLQPRPAFGATDPDASQVAPAVAGTPAAAPAPFTPTPIDAAPTDTVKVSSEGADKAAEQDKDSDQARKDEAGDAQPKDAQTDGPDFAGIKERSQADAENRQRDLKAQGEQNPKTTPPRSNETDAITQQASASKSAGARLGGNTGYREPEPALGRIVMYSLTQEDADRMNVRRVYGPKGDDGTPLEEGVSLQAGTMYPAMIVAIGDQVLNLQVFPDGNHGVWVRDVAKGTDAGSWSWPVIK